MLFKQITHDETWAVLSGDSLFVGDVARTDLAVEQAEGDRQIFRSVHQRLLPDDCELWPAHLGGSMCSGPGMDMKICSTVGYECQHNPTLAIADEDEFVAQALAKLGPQPPNSSGFGSKLAWLADYEAKSSSAGVGPRAADRRDRAAGVRAATAASLLRHHGAARVIHVIDGGVPLLAEEGLRLEGSAAR